MRSVMLARTGKRGVLTCGWLLTVGLSRRFIYKCFTALRESREALTRETLVYMVGSER